MTKRGFPLFFVVVALALAQNPNHGNAGNNGKPDDEDNAAILVPDSSVEHPEDAGNKAHTNHIIALRGQAIGSVPTGLKPKQIWTAYGLGSPSGSGTIAIVDAYHYPSAFSDLTTFSSNPLIGLPVPGACVFNLSTLKVSGSGCFLQVYADSKAKLTSVAPRTNCGWAQESALDIEWAHAMAPYANIVLVEAVSNSNSDLFAAVDLATQIVNKSGGGQVSMSWGGSESAGEATYESHFNGTNVVYFAASGDTGGKTIYPGVSPNVVSAGGTTLRLNLNNGISSETGWSGSGGGTSPYFGRPGYQDVITNIVGTQRGVPDFSFVADPSTGVSVYDSTRCYGMQGWMVFGGTSVSSPSLAGIVNAARSHAASTNAELSTVYGNLATDGLLKTSSFNDITSGKAGSYSAKAGWDFVTGVGSSDGLNGK